MKEGRKERKLRNYAESIVDLRKFNDQKLLSSLEYLPFRTNFKRIYECLIKVSLIPFYKNSYLIKF